jgi:transposase InsO family protein
VTFRFIATEKAAYPIRVLCRTLGVSASGFYAWQARPAPSPRRQQDAVLRHQLRVAHGASRGVYGSPRLHQVLRQAGHRISRKRVIRLMRVDGLCGRARRRFRVTTAIDPYAQPATNRLGRQFTVAAPNRVWAADITAIATHEGWLYLAVLLDLWSRRIVGWAVRPTLETEVVCAALQVAVARRRAQPGLLHHSDRGAQYTSDRYQALLRLHGFHCSMSRPGNCYDNAPVESFFRTLKTELAPPTHVTRRAATTVIAEYIERFYNRERLHSTLHYQSPAVFEATWKTAV